MKSYNMNRAYSKSILIYLFSYIYYYASFELILLLIKQLFYITLAAFNDKSELDSILNLLLFLLIILSNFLELIPQSFDILVCYCEVR